MFNDLKLITKPKPPVKINFIKCPTEAEGLGKIDIRFNALLSAKETQRKCATRAEGCFTSTEERQNINFYFDANL